MASARLMSSMAGLESFLDTCYEDNRAIVMDDNCGSINRPSLSMGTPSELPADSFDTIYMLLNNKHVEETSNASLKGEYIEPTEPEPAHLSPKTARSISLAILSRISRLMLGSVDSTLRVLLPNEASALYTNSSSLTTQILLSSPASSSSSLAAIDASPRSEFDRLLVAWGRLAFYNLKNINDSGFVTGVPLVSIMRPSSLVMLEALASWPGDWKRASLMVNASQVMDDFLSQASAGCHIISSSSKCYSKPFQRLLELILQNPAKENHSPRCADGSFTESPCPVKSMGVRDGENDKKLSNITIPFIDDSLAFTPAPGRCLRKQLNVDHLISPVLRERHSQPIDSFIEKPTAKRTSEPSLRHLRSVSSPPKARQDTATAIQLALLFLPTESRFQFQLFVERAARIVANVENHIFPEVTMNYARPTTLATWFAPRLLPSSTNSDQSPGHALIEFILSCPDALTLLKPPPTPFTNWANQSMSEYPDALSVTSPLKKASFDKAEEENEVQINSQFGRLMASKQLCPCSQQQICSPVNQPLPVCRRVEFDAAILAFNRMSVDLDGNSDGGRISPVSCPVNGNTISLTSDMSTPPSETSLSGNIEHVLALGNVAHLIQSLNFFINDRKMDPKVKMRYLKQFENTHPDVFWMRFGEAATARDYYAKLQRRIDQARAIRRAQSPSIADRFARLFRRRGVRNSSAGTPPGTPRALSR